MRGPVGSSVLALTLLAACARPSPCAAQAGGLMPTASPPPTDSAAPSAVSPAIERFVREKRDATGRPAPPPARSASIPVPPSAVSPAIERFVRENRREAAGRAASSPSMPPAGDLPTALPAAEPRGGPANPLSYDRTLKPAPLEPVDRRFPINLATALKLSDARPLIVASAQASVGIAEAELTRAKVLWIPTLTFAADYIRHDGGGPDFNKGILTAPSTNYFYAGPSLFQYLNLTDAIFQPLAARQVLNSRQWDVQAAKNDALLRTADAYFQVHQYRGIYAGALYSVERGNLLRERIESLSGELVPRVEVERAKNLLAELQQRAALARQEWRVQSADLTQVLRLDPRAVIEPVEHDHTQITLIDPGRDLGELMAIALANRPELSSRRAMVSAAEARVRREKARPLLPLVELSGFQTAGTTIQAGVFGLGPNSSLNQWAGREDVSIQCVWQLENFGIGNLARVKRQRGEQSRSIVDLRRTQDDVAAEVTRAHAHVQSAAVRVLQADRALRTGLITFNGQLEGLAQTRRFGDVLVLVSRPQEAVYALQLLNVAFEEYFTTVADYNRAQFELFHALGYPAREIADQRPPGEVLPVDTNRPAYLPPVGNGPPPATR